MTKRFIIIEMVEKRKVVEADDLTDVAAEYPNAKIEEIITPVITTFSLFNQTEVWVSKDKTPKLISDIDERYAKNILAFIERHATNIEFAYTTQETLFLPSEDDDWIVDMTDVWQSRHENPVEFVKNTPLYRALVLRAEP